MDTPQSTYFGSLRRCFNQASRRVAMDPEQRYFRFANKRVRFQIAGAKLARSIVLPFRHLETGSPSGDSADLAIQLWDVDASGVKPPADLQPEENTTWQCEGGSFTRYPDDRFVSFTQTTGTTWFDMHSRTIVGWRTSAGALSVYERSKPLPLILPLWYGSQDVQILHSGLVVHEDRGILVAGQSGSGKTTVCLACLFGGFEFLGDDQVGLKRQPSGAYTGYSLFNSIRLDTRQLSFFPQLRSFVQSGKRVQDDKQLVLAFELIKPRTRKQASIAAIAFPFITEAENGFYPMKKSQAMLRLAPSSLIVPLGSGRKGFSQLAEFVERVPAFSLCVGPDPETIPGLVRELSEEAVACV